MSYSEQYAYSQGAVPQYLSIHLSQHFSVRGPNQGQYSTNSPRFENTVYSFRYKTQPQRETSWVGEDDWNYCWSKPSIYTVRVMYYWKWKIRQGSPQTHFRTVRNALVNYTVRCNYWIHFLHFFGDYFYLKEAKQLLRITWEAFNPQPRFLKSFFFVLKLHIPKYIPALHLA